MEQYVRTLTIAGSDSGGGAGIQADLKTFSALGCYGMSVVTALTAQNTREVRNIQAVPGAFIADQMRAVLEDIGVDAVKIGMLHAPEVIRVVAEVLGEHKVMHTVLDPVMVAKSGDRLLQEEAVDALRETLLPQVQVITPNLPEGGILLGQEIGEGNMESAAKALGKFGPEAVLLKGGHGEGTMSTDVLYLKKKDETLSYEAPRIRTQNTHGTGCTLSSAIAAYIAHGEDIAEAVRKAKNYLTDALQAGSAHQLGHGHGPVHHFHRLWPQNTDRS